MAIELTWIAHGYRGTIFSDQIRQAQPETQHDAPLGHDHLETRRAVIITMRKFPVFQDGMDNFLTFFQSFCHTFQISDFWIFFFWLLWLLSTWRLLSKSSKHGRFEFQARFEYRRVSQGCTDDLLVSKTRAMEDHHFLFWKGKTACMTKIGAPVGTRNGGMKSWWFGMSRGVEFWPEARQLMRADWWSVCYKWVVWFQTADPNEFHAQNMKLLSKSFGLYSFWTYPFWGPYGYKWGIYCRVDS